jgi:hypothetical protein
MLDLETWGTVPGVAIRSVGAAVFDPHGEGHGETFYRNIIDRTCWVAGLTVDKSTAAWWGKQSIGAQEVFANDPRPIVSVISEFHAFVMKHGTLHPWCQGSGFDTAIWEAAAKAVGSPVPWKFWNLRDTRTAYHLAGLDERSITREGVAHNALDDAIHQVKCVQAACRKLREK